MADEHKEPLVIDSLTLVRYKGWVYVLPTRFSPTPARLNNAGDLTQELSHSALIIVEDDDKTTLSKELLV